MSRFEHDTAVAALGSGRYGATVDPGWWIERGPNGGYLAAMVARAVTTEVDDPRRRLRTLTLHYLRPPVAGPCEVRVVVERAGRGLSTVTARLLQEGRDCVLALAALGVDRPGVQVHDHPPPAVPPPDEVPVRVVASAAEPDIPFRHRFEVRPALGPPPFSGGAEALTGGWIRPADDQPLDDLTLVALTDAWMPALFSRIEQRAGVPTVELTVHLRDRPTGEPGWCLVRFTTRSAGDGYLEETGEVWSDDGRLLAESRQLAVVLAR